jgi:hypothetical protein
MEKIIIKYKRSLKKALALYTIVSLCVGALGFALPTGTAQAASWSDNFNGGSQQTWTIVDGGASSTYAFQNNRYELHTEGEAYPGAAKSLVSYIAGSITDSVSQVRIKKINSGDNFLAYQLLRGNIANMNGYVCGASSDGVHFWFGKLTGGVYSAITTIGSVTYDSSDFIMRCSIVGSNLYGKIWTYGTAEPSSWQITATDATYSSGGVGGIMVATYPHPAFNWVNVQAAFDDFIVVPSTDVVIISTVDVPQVTVTTTAVIMVNSVVTNPTIDVSSLVATSTGTLPEITIISDPVNIAIPADTVVTGDVDWGGVLEAPTVTTVDLPAGSDLETAISIGYSGHTLTFSKAVRMLFPNDKDKRAGYTIDGVSFTEITASCGTDDQTIVDALLAGDEDGNCKINVGDDLVVWTKHFTDYYTYTSGSDVETSAEVENVAPVASGVAVNGTDAWIDLTENTTADVIVTVTVTDNNGCENITGASVKFYKTDTAASTTDNANYRYTAAAVLDAGTNCEEGGADLSSTWTATIPVQYYANPDEWTAVVTPSDASTTGAVATDTIQVAGLVALDVTETIAYGPLALNANTGTTDQATVVTNTGNVAIRTQVNSGTSTAMTCGIGTIPVGNERYSVSASTDWATKIGLSATAATVGSFSVAKRTTDSTSASLYWGLGMPLSGVSGSCSGTVVFTPII